MAESPLDTACLTGALLRTLAAFYKLLPPAPLPLLLQFLRGRSILITGATGFLAKARHGEQGFYGCRLGMLLLLQSSLLGT